MKRPLIAACAALALSGCAETMYVGNRTCRPYGIVNQEQQCPQAVYEVRPGNAVAAVMLFPFFPFGTIGTAYIVGYRLWGPVKSAQSTQPIQQ